MIGNGPVAVSVGGATVVSSLGGWRKLKRCTIGPTNLLAMRPGRITAPPAAAVACWKLAPDCAHSPPLPVQPCVVVPVPGPVLPAPNAVAVVFHLCVCVGAENTALETAPVSKVRSPLVLVMDRLGFPDAAVANVPLFIGVAWSAPLTVTAQSVPLCAVVHDAVAVCEPDGGAAHAKIIERGVAPAVESLPETSGHEVPPTLALKPLLPLASCDSPIAQALFEPEPIVNDGVVRLVTVPAESAGVATASNATATSGRRYGDSS